MTAITELSAAAIPHAMVPTPWAVVAAGLAGLAVLPLCGVGLGYLLGGDPIAFLVSGPLGWACLIGGAVFAACGVLWIEWLARQVGRPA